ncbi:tectonic-3 [Spea bombifrons]|uniref:tectonic-3 n=1 Tax=Spea bombifrons TaxID=233779 RepID=UPI00234A3DBD|nr:tectonic-3 [Spea bombifrons]
MGRVMLLLLLGVAVGSEVRLGTGDSRASGAVTICTCDLSPAICDLNCCCDPDCESGDPASVFSFCLPGSVSVRSQVCLYGWLLFRSNSPYPTALIPASPPRTPELFCVLPVDPSLNYFVAPQTVDATNFSKLADKWRAFSFSPLSSPVPTFPDFYKADDPVLAVSRSGTVGVLIQPAPVGAQNLCSDSNPARFLRSSNTSCQREIRNLSDSCLADPWLSARHYYQNISVFRVPKDVINGTALKVELTGPVPDSPTLQGGRCHNVVSQVVYTVLYNGTQGITNVSVRFALVNASGARLQQEFEVNYQASSRDRTRTPCDLQNVSQGVPGVTPASPGERQTYYFQITGSVSAPASGLRRSGNPGYLAGLPVLADTGSLSAPSLQGDGSCSRRPVQFGVNALSGCSIRGELAETCESLRTRAYNVLLGEPWPRQLGAFGNGSTLRIPIIYENCTDQAVGDCKTGCLLPVFLRTQILWAEVGLLSNPQAQIQGARFRFSCRVVSCLDVTVLRSQASFTDITRRGPPPRSHPGITAREPLDFFYPFRTSGSAPACAGPGPVFALLVLTVMLFV